MNLTINALSLALLTSPTLIFSQQNINLKGLNILYSFDHFLYGYNQKIQNSFVAQSTFGNFLSSPILILQNWKDVDNEKVSISNQFITKTSQYSNCNNYEFLSNTFYNCVSKGDHNQGGAIYISCDNQNSNSDDIGINVKMANNCYLNCEADQGGSFFIKCHSATLQENSFKNCEAVYYSILYLNVQKEVILKQSHFAFSSKEESTRGNAINIETNDDIIEKNLNISSNKLNSAHCVFYASSPLIGKSIVFNYLNFYNNTSKNVLFMYTPYNSVIENSNFIKNQGFESLIELKIQIRCQSCAFISDNSKLISTRYTVFSLCVFDDDEDQIRFTHHTLSNCKFNIDKTFDVKIEPEPVCMTQESSNIEPTNEKKVFLASFLPIFFIIVIVAIIFTVIYGIKHNWFRRKTDTMPLMYV